METDTPDGDPKCPSRGVDRTCTSGKSRTASKPGTLRSTSLVERIEGLTGALEGGGDGRSGQWTEAVTRWTDVAAPIEVAVGRVAVEVRRGKRSREGAG